MDFMLIVYDDKTTLITESIYAPLPTDKGVISRFPFSTLADAQNAKMLHQITNVRTTYDDTAMRDTISQQAEIIRKQNVEIAGLESRVKWLEHSIGEIDAYFERAKRDIALEIITHGTHRERDLYYKRQVLNMVTVQEVFINSREADDIPF